MKSKRLKPTAPFEKSHRFVLTVKTFRTKRQAEIAVLKCFCLRNPDGCKFDLKRIAKTKDVRVDRISKQIVTCLFRVSNGKGYVAGKRIAVKTGIWPNESEIGGWCKESAAEEIRRILTNVKNIST